MHLVQSGHSELLVASFEGRATWPPAVRAELLRASSRIAGLRSLATGSFATVVDLEDAEELEVEDLRLETLTRAEIKGKPTKNRGEAECVVVCRRMRMPVVMHDEVGRAWARQRGVRLFTIVDCLCLAARLGLVRPSQAWRAYERTCRDGMIGLAAFPLSEAGRRAFMARIEPVYSEYTARAS
jgi:predicted nucleic acid-binding protein